VVDRSDDSARPRRAFISYAQQADSPGHGESVLRLWALLRDCGIDARLDLPAAQQRQDWTLWMADEIRAADFVLVIASPAYRERAEGRSDPDVGQGVQYEARLIREAFFRDQRRLDRFVPVVLPGQDIDGLPDFLGPAISTVYRVSNFTVSGANALLRFLTGQPEIVERPLGKIPVLDPRAIPTNPAPAPNRTETPRRHRPDSLVHNEVSGIVTGVVIQAGNVGGLEIPSANAWQPSIEQRPVHVVGAGVRGWKSAFQSHYAALRQSIAVGEPTTDVEQYGPGVRQEFSGGWVLCALPDGPVLAVTESIWDALHIVGSGVEHGEPLAALGFPVSDDPRELYVDDDAICVELRGGTWGAGRLRRPDMTRDWEWQPKPDNFSRTTTPAALDWTAGFSPPRLRIRAIASLHVVRSTDWEITPERRRQFEDALPASRLTQVFTRLPHGRPVMPWRPGPNANYPDRASYICAADGKPIFEAEVMAAGSSSQGVVTCAEVRIHNKVGRLPGSDRPIEPHLTLPEVCDFLAAAWQMTTVGLLDLLSFPKSRPRWREVPKVEFRVTAECEYALTELIDFTRFGLASPGQHPEMAVTILAVPYLSDDERQTLTRQALVYMGRNFGYLEATTDRF
jgi:hypothetical protein